MPIKQSNRLTVVLNDDMTVSYKQGVSAVYLNSYLYNEFVVRPQSKLRVTQTLWITFATSANFNAATNKTQPTLLAYRDVTLQNGIEEVADDAHVQTVSDCEQSFEYYIQIPDIVLKVPGAWYFSLEIREVPNINEPENYSKIATSGIYSFIVNNSLAGQGQGNRTPSNLDIVALYLTAVDAVSASATAKDYAQQAQEAAKAATYYAPYIGKNNHWFVFDNKAMQFVDTGIVAEGINGVSVVWAQTQEDSVTETDNYTVTPVCLVFDNQTLSQPFPIYAKNGERGADCLICNEIVKGISPYDTSFHVDVSAFNKTPKAGDEFLAFFEYEGTKWVVMSRVARIALTTVHATTLSRLEVTGQKGEKGEKGDNYYTFSIKEGDLIVKTTEADNPDVTHGIDSYGNMILTLK